MKLNRIAGLVIGFGLATTPASALVFHITYDANVQADANFASIQTAVNYVSN